MNRAKKDGVSSSVLNLSISPTSAKHAKPHERTAAEDTLQ